MRLCVSAYVHTCASLGLCVSVRVSVHVCVHVCLWISVLMCWGEASPGESGPGDSSQGRPPLTQAQNYKVPQRGAWCVHVCEREPGVLPQRVPRNKVHPLPLRPTTICLSPSCRARPLQPVGGTRNLPGQERPDGRNQGLISPEGGRAGAAAPSSEPPSHLGHGAGHHPHPRRLLAVLTPSLSPTASGLLPLPHKSPSRSRPPGPADRVADSSSRGPPGASGKVRRAQCCPGPLGDGAGPTARGGHL